MREHETSVRGMRRGEKLGSTMNIIYGPQNDNLPARQVLGALSVYSYLFTACSYRWYHKNTCHPMKM